VTIKGAARPLSPRGIWGHALPRKNLESRSSEMQYSAFWASKQTVARGPTGGGRLPVP